MLFNLEKRVYLRL